jgi:uncharacterized cupredoxin-like copper-binding protein
MVRILARFCLLAVLAILVGVVVVKSRPRPVLVDIVMVDDKFVPDHLIFRQGVSYRLHLVNHGNDTHEFTAPTFFASADIHSPGALNRERTEVVVDPGGAKDVFLTPRRAGTYDLHCSDHDWDGMVGGITVE